MLQLFLGTKVSKKIELKLSNKVLYSDNKGNYLEIIT